MKRKSFSLIEVVVGVVLLAIAFGGVFTAFVAARNYVEHAQGRLIAINLARRSLEDLYEFVSADTWDTGFLRDGLSQTEPGYVIDTIEFGGTNPNHYDVSEDGVHNFRQVDMTVNFGARGSGIIGGPGP